MTALRSAPSVENTTETGVWREAKRESTETNMIVTDLILLADKEDPDPGRGEGEIDPFLREMTEEEDVDFEELLIIDI